MPDLHIVNLPLQFAVIILPGTGQKIDRHLETAGSLLAASKVASRRVLAEHLLDKLIGIEHQL